MPSAHSHNNPNKKGYIFKIRQILNLLFIVIGIIGAGMNAYGKWVSHDDKLTLMGIIVVVIAMAMKMAECVLRYIK